MKKVITILMMLACVMMICFCSGMAMAEGADAAAPPALNGAQIVNAQMTYTEAEVPETPFTWAYLASIAGATAATLLIVEFMKFPLDRVWKIPTRALVYVIALVILLAATWFTGEMSWEKAALAALNAFIVAAAAMGAYEVTFRKTEAR